MRLLTLAREDLRLTLRDRSSIFWIFVAPFLWTYMFGLLARQQDPSQTKVSLQVVREDASPAAERLLDNLRSENFTLTVAGPGEAPPAEKRAPPRRLTIPAGFGDSLAERRKVKLALHEEERANPEGTFAAQVALHKAIVRLLAGEAFGVLDPAGDQVRVRAGFAGVRKVPTGLYQSIPGNLVMFVLIATLTYGAAGLAKERKDGLLRRLASSPLTRTELILGKLAGRAAIASLQVGIFLFIGLAVFRIDWGSSPAGLLLLLASLVACAASLSLLAGTLFTSAEAASGLGVVLTLAMSGLGGCWWPSEIMPRWLQTASLAFPTAWAMDGLHQLLSWGGGLADVLAHASVLCLFALGAGTLAVRLLKAAA